jgi:hypothetical protein
VQVFAGLVAGEDEERPQHGLQEDRGLRCAEQIPEGDRRSVSVPGDTAKDEGDEVQRYHGAADDDVDGDHRHFLLRGSGFGLLMRKITM